ncbi:MAG: STAS domain-containing protein [Candidatus Omnitrophica bacterium]|nr:STAS domain-containing protein [Candidatus Omnitrophota bacterium]
MAELISNEKTGDINLVRFSFNEITREQREQIKRKLQDLMDSGEKKFIIDLDGVGFVSSLVIATIIFFAKQVRENGGTIKISGLSNEAFSIFQLTQLDRILELYETEHDALESFKNID